VLDDDLLQPQLVQAATELPSVLHSTLREAGMPGFVEQIAAGDYSHLFRLALDMHCFAKAHPDVGPTLTQ
jgi:hypothetical protein